MQKWEEVGGGSNHLGELSGQALRVWQIMNYSLEMPDCNAITLILWIRKLRPRNI